VIIVRTPRTILRKLRADDLDDLCRLYADDDIRRFFPEGPLDRDQTKEELDWYVKGGWPEHPELGLWATIHRQTNRFIGRCGLIPWIVDNQVHVEIAYLLAKEFWREGLASEIGAAIVQHAFTELRLNRLIALIDRDNVASIRTAQKLGFQFEQYTEVEGQTTPLYALLRHTPWRGSLQA
jgi:ribosomal-protein-alanine N-acetyltransferase